MARRVGLYVALLCGQTHTPVRIKAHGGSSPPVITYAATTGRTQPGDLWEAQRCSRPAV